MPGSAAWASLKAKLRRMNGDREDIPSVAAPAKPGRDGPVRVLFVDVGNASRSQVAQAYAILAGFEASSAGTFPALRVSPEAVSALKEDGVDITGWRPKPLDPARLPGFDLVVTFGVRLPGPARRNVEDWNVLDPQGMSVGAHATMCAEIRRRVQELARRHGVRPIEAA